MNVVSSHHSEDTYAIFIIFSSCLFHIFSFFFSLFCFSCVVFESATLETQMESLSAEEALPLWSSTWSDTAGAFPGGSPDIGVTRPFPLGCLCCMVEISYVLLGSSGWYLRRVLYIFFSLKTHIQFGGLLFKLYFLNWTQLI